MEIALGMRRGMEKSSRQGMGQVKRPWAFGLHGRHMQDRPRPIGMRMESRGSGCPASCAVWPRPYPVPVNGNPSRARDAHLRAESVFWRFELELNPPHGLDLGSGIVLSNWLFSDSEWACARGSHGMAQSASHAPDLAHIKSS